MEPLLRPMASTQVDDLVGLNDPKLAPLLRARDRVSFEQQLDRLIMRVARPVIVAVLSGHLRFRGELTPDDGEDIAANVQLRLVSKLRAVSTSAAEAIDDFDDYVARLAHNAIKDHLRRKFPARTRLKNRLRYALKTDGRLASDVAAERVVCRLRAWGADRSALSLRDLDEGRLPRAVFDARRPADALAGLLEHLQAPLPLDDAVTLFVRLWQVSETAEVGADEALAVSAPPAAELETRDYLAALWGEIRELRPLQRTALLLNLRSETPVNVASLFVLTGLATFDELARTLEIAPRELAEIWHELPLDDTRIAARLGITRQQVINLRKSARERLARRMGKKSTRS